MSARKVVVTGLGLVCPVGNCVESAWTAIKAGQSGISRISLFDASSYGVQIAGEVKDFEIAAYGVSRSAGRKMARFSQFLFAAAKDAVKDSELSSIDLQNEKTGVIVGNCLGGQEIFASGYSFFYGKDFSPGKMPPLTIPMAISSEAAANLSISLGLHGPAWTVNTACASGTDSLGLALDTIRSGRLDICVAGGTEAAINGFNIACYDSLMTLASSYNDKPQKASRPFDREREGFVVGEGAAVLVLEEELHALRRGAKIYAELAGYGSSEDACHITAPLKDGSCAALAVSEALHDAGLDASDIQYYNAHGTSTKLNDIAETNMIKTVFGQCAAKLHISSTKSMTGHLIGAAGAIEALFCIKAINDSFVPPTINLDNPDVEGGCDLDYTPNRGRQCEIQAAASASLGFGGHNACVVLKKYI